MSEGTRFLFNIAEVVVRKIDKRGRVLYYDTNRKRIVRLRDWTRQFARGVPPELPPMETLSKREQASIKSRQRIRYNGKFLNKLQEKFIRDDLAKTGQRLIMNDVVKTFGKDAADQILKQQFPRWVNSDSRNNFNIEKELIRAMKQGFAIRFKEVWNEWVGMEAIMELKRREAELIDQAMKDGMKSPVVLYLIKEDRETGELLVDDEDTRVIGS